MASAAPASAWAAPAEAPPQHAAYSHQQLQPQPMTTAQHRPQLLTAAGPPQSAGASPAPLNNVGIGHGVRVPMAPGAAQPGPSPMAPPPARTGAARSGKRAVNHAGPRSKLAPSEANIERARRIAAAAAAAAARAAKLAAVQQHAAAAVSAAVSRGRGRSASAGGTGPAGDQHGAEAAAGASSHAGPAAGRGRVAGPVVGRPGSPPPQHYPQGVRARPSASPGRGIPPAPAVSPPRQHGAASSPGRSRIPSPPPGYQLNDHRHASPHRSPHRPPHQESPTRSSRSRSPGSPYLQQPPQPHLHHHHGQQQHRDHHNHSERHQHQQHQYDQHQHMQERARAPVSYSSLDTVSHERDHRRPSPPRGYLGGRSPPRAAPADSTSTAYDATSYSSITGPPSSTGSPPVPLQDAGYARRQRLQVRGVLHSGGDRSGLLVLSCQSWQGWAHGIRRYAYLSLIIDCSQALKDRRSRGAGAVLPGVLPAEASDLVGYGRSRTSFSICCPSMNLKPPPLMENSRWVIRSPSRLGITVFC